VKSFLSTLILSSCFLSASASQAQNTGRIECARSDGYIYLYSSLTTMEVRSTLQCNDIVQIVAHYDAYYSVRTAKGEVGYVPASSIVLLKDQVGPGLLPLAQLPARERMHYGEAPKPTPAPSGIAATGMTLRNGTPIRVKLAKAISSASAHVGDSVEFEVLEDVLVDGAIVVARGANANGVIAVAEPKKRFGKEGKLAFSIKSVLLIDNKQAPVRCYHEAYGSSNATSGSVLPLASGRDVEVAQNTEFTVLVDGDVHLNREAFGAPKAALDSSPSAPAQDAHPGP